MLGRVILQKSDIPPFCSSEEFAIGAIAKRFSASDEMAGALPDRPARARPAAGNGVGTMEKRGDLSVTEPKRPGIEGNKRIAEKEARARGLYLRARQGDQAPQRAKSLRQPPRIGKVTDQKSDVDGTEASAGALKPQNCRAFGVAQEDVFLAGRADHEVAGRVATFDQ